MRIWCAIFGCKKWVQCRHAAGIWVCSRCGRLDAVSTIAEVRNMRSLIESLRAKLMRREV